MSKNAKWCRSVDSTVTPILASIPNSDCDIDALIEKHRARRERERERIVAEFGDISDGDISRVLLTEDERAVCDNCSGVCTKTNFRYKKPFAYADAGTVYVSNYPCKYGIDHQFRCSCVAAGVPEKYIGRSFDDYKVTATNERAVKIAKFLSVNKSKRGAFLYGGTGTGKTFLAALIALSRIRDGKSVVFYDMPTLFDAIKNTFDNSKESTADFLDRVCVADLLVLDDMGAEKVTDWTSEMLYLIVNRRYNADRPLVATANFDFDGLEHRLGNDLTARRILSRLKEMCAEAFFGTTDWRTAR